MPSSRLSAEVRRLPLPRSFFQGRSYAELCLVNNVLLFRRTERRDLQRATFELRPHHRCVLVFNLATTGVVDVDGTRVALEPNHGLLILPFQRHSFPEVARDDLLWLFVTFETAQLGWLEDFRAKVFPLDPAAVRTMEEVLEHFGRPEEETRTQLLALGVASLLARLRPHVKQAGAPRAATDRRARQLLADVDACLRAAKDAALSIDQLAAKLHISEGRLRARFRASAGTTVGAYVANYRLHRAIDLMRDTRLTLTEIAAELTFGDSAAFSRFFRRQTGSTARDFRRRMLALTGRAGV